MQVVAEKHYCVPGLCSARLALINQQISHCLVKRGSHSNYKLSVIYKKLKYFTPLILLLQKLHLQVTAKKQNLKKICRIVQKVIRKGLSTSLTDVTWISFCLFIKAFTSENKEKSQCAFYVRSVQVFLG